MNIRNTGRGYVTKAKSKHVALHLPFIQEFEPTKETFFEPNQSKTIKETYTFTFDQTFSIKLLECKSYQSSAGVKTSGKILSMKKISNAQSHHCTVAWVTRPERPKAQRAQSRPEDF